MSDLEILDTVEFFAFLVTRGNRESISAECQIFYPVAFFLGALKGIPYYDVINPSPRKGLQIFFFKYRHIIYRWKENFMLNKSLFGTYVGK